MNRYICITLFFLMANPFNILIGQNKIKWLTWEEAIEKSKKEKKKIFVDVYTDWCGWCKKMDKTTFVEDHIAKYVNSNYYAVKFDAEMKTPITIKGKTYNYIKNGASGYHELAASLLQGKLSYPSMVFLDEEFTIIQSIPGYQDSPTFEMIITYFGSNSHKNIPWNRFMMAYERHHFFDYTTKAKN